MYKKTKLSQAVSLAIVTSSLTLTGPTLAQTRTIEEIVVTATKRAENLQDVAITVQALGEESLDNLKVENFADYVKQLPNVNFAGRGPGQNDVFIRGISTGRSGSILQSGGLGAGPLVAFYVDEAPLSSAGRNVDAYITDVARIEVLPGPQGTLYGASSQAGTLRVITNKPNFDGVSGNIEVTAEATEHGEPSWGVEGFVNIPIVEDKLAIRVAAYNTETGGYIDNVPGTISLAQNPSLATNGGPFPVAANADLRVANNNNMIEDDINDYGYTGVRATALFDINEDWNITAGVIHQKLDTEGVFDFSPEIGDLEVSRFAPDSLDDEFTQFNWTLNGRIADLDVVYTGSYLNREIEQNVDINGFIDLRFEVFYNCARNAVGEIFLCGAPDWTYQSFQDSTDVQHELRFSTNPDNALRLTAGVYYDNSDGGVTQEWSYHSPQITLQGANPLDFAPNAPVTGSTNFINGARDPEVAFFNDISPQAEQIAVFGELTYDFAENWSISAGFRWFDIDVEALGSFNFVSFGAPPAVDGDGGGSLDPIPDESEDDVIKKFTLSYAPSDNALLYATFSEGFRRGGFNRGGDVFNLTTGQLAFPAFFRSDSIENYEFGWKMNFLQNRLRFNGALYYIDWSDVQFETANAAIFGNLRFTANIGEAEVIGVEGDVSFLATDQLSFFGAFSYNRTELTERNPVAITLLDEGADLALSPNFQGTVNARYDFPLFGHDAYAQIGVQYSDESINTLTVADLRKMNDYATADASFGINYDKWKIKLFVTNFTDARPQLFFDKTEFIDRQVTARPRTVTLKVSRDF